jgi:hypothetical protein
LPEARVGEAEQLPAGRPQQGATLTPASHEVSYGSKLLDGVRTWAPTTMAAGRFFIERWTSSR